MFIAKSEKGEVVNLLFLTKGEIAELAKKKWCCCSCGLPLSIKNGPLKQSHFAHRKSCGCQNFSEGETEEHLLGKRILAQWCDKFKLVFKLEAYLPELKQRPDVLLQGKIVIEFQCSQLSLERFVERTQNYQRHGYQVIWILGQHFFVGRRLTGFQRACLTYHHNIGFYLWELDVFQEVLSCVLHVEEELGAARVYYSRKKWQMGSEAILKVFKFPEESQLFIRRQHKALPLLLSYFDKLERGLMASDRQTLLIQEQFYQQGVHLRGLDICFFYQPRNHF